MSMNTKGVYHYLSAAAEEARPLKVNPGGFDQGVQDGLDQALFLVRESLGRKGSLECLAEFCDTAHSSASRSPYRAGVSQGADIIQSSLAGYVDDQNSKRIRRGGASLNAVALDAAESQPFPVDPDVIPTAGITPLLSEDA